MTTDLSAVKHFKMIWLQQHFEYVPFFHGDKLEFFKSKARDKKKKEWCRINNITLIELRYDERDRWEEQLSRK